MKPLVDPSWNMKRLEAEIERCLTGAGGRQPHQHGEDILWLMGWADLSIERELMLEHGSDCSEDIETKG